MLLMPFCGVKHVGELVSVLHSHRAGGRRKMKKQSCTPKKTLILFNIYDLKYVIIICVIKCLWEIANLQASAKCCFLFSSKSVISILQSVGNINLIYVW